MIKERLAECSNLIDDSLEPVGFFEINWGQQKGTSQIETPLEWENSKQKYAGLIPTNWYFDLA